MATIGSNPYSSFYNAITGGGTGADTTNNLPAWWINAVSNTVVNATTLTTNTTTPLYQRAIDAADLVMTHPALAQDVNRIIRQQFRHMTDVDDLLLQPQRLSARDAKEIFAWLG
jgi:hypothetical protein